MKAWNTMSTESHESFGKHLHFLINNHNKVRRTFMKRVGTMNHISSPGYITWPLSDEYLWGKCHSRNITCFHNVDIGYPQSHAL